MARSASTRVSVLIVGAGPVGLSMALLLAHHGVPCRLVERRPAPNDRPTAILLNSRTMEILRQCGTEEAIRATALPPSLGRFLLRVHTVAGQELERRVATITAGAQEPFSPISACVSSLGALPGTLASCARISGGAELRFGSELLGFEQHADRVVARLRNRGSSDEMAVEAEYLIAADGARSGVREALGIAMIGQGKLPGRVLTTFKADLRPWFVDRPPYRCVIEHPEARGGLFVVDGAEIWRFDRGYDPDRGERPEDFTTDRCIALVRAAVGVADLPVEILSVDPWTPGAHVAERYRDGRVFLVGDAAHEMPPSGGLGMNTGIQDAHNLAWKLAARLQGRAADSLLDSYQAERPPAGRVTTDRALANRRVPGTPVPQPANRPASHTEWGLIFGASYHSSAIIPDGSDPPVLGDPTSDYVPTARPGARAPHVWLQAADHPISILDLFGKHFVVLAGASGGAWCEAASIIASQLGLPLTAYRVGHGRDLSDPKREWQDTYGVRADGAVLIRPDGYVAWRSRCAHPAPEDELRRAMVAILGLG